ncbi:C-type lectin domain family 17, member A-like [Cetorhinus maximus]
MEQDTDYMNIRHIKNNTTAPSEHDPEILYSELNFLPASGTTKVRTTGEREPSYAQVSFTPRSPQQNQGPEVTPGKGKAGQETVGGKRSKKSRCLTVVGLIVIICNFAIITGLTVQVLQMNKEHDAANPLNRTLAIALRNLTELDGKFQKLSETARSLCPMLRICSESLCPSGWNDHNLHCYRFSTEGGNWDSAKRQCESQNSHLIIINTEQEQKSIKNNRGTYWIGLTNRESERHWKWVDGTPVSFTRWDQGEPNNWYGNENCAVIRSASWNDVSCSNHFRFICEERALPCVEAADIEKYCS